MHSLLLQSKAAFSVVLETMSHLKNICQQIWSIWQSSARDQPIDQWEDRTKGKIESLKYKIRFFPDQNTSAIVNTRFIKCLEKIKISKSDQLSPPNALFESWVPLLKFKIMVFFEFWRSDLLNLHFGLATLVIGYHTDPSLSGHMIPGSAGSEWPEVERQTVRF